MFQREAISQKEIVFLFLKEIQSEKDWSFDILCVMRDSGMKGFSANAPFYGLCRYVQYVFFKVIFVRNRVSILVTLVSNWVWFLRFSLELGLLSTFRRAIFSLLTTRLVIKAINSQYLQHLFLNQEFLPQALFALYRSLPSFTL